MSSHWENCYQTGDTHWDRGAPSPPLRQYLGSHPLTGRILVPGCGTGHDVALLAAQGAQPTGLDIAPSAVRQAASNYPHLAAQFVLGDLFNLPPDWAGSFDAVVEHTCFCAILPTQRLDYCRAVVDALKPGGMLVGVWFINPALDPGETGPPFPSSPEQLDEVFRPHFALVEDYVPDVAYQGREGRERIRVWRKR